jgi:hypothetical protein
MKPAARHVCVLFAFSAVAAETSWSQDSIVGPVSTVSDAVFRSQWVGPQADRPELVGMVPTGEGIKPVEDMATKVREGLWLGSLRIRPGFGAGWAYSDRNSQGQTTSNANNDQSFFLSPSLGLEYGRDTGPWTISGRAGGGYVYYLNPDYSPNGTGANRNPYNGTMSLGIGHSGLRHDFDLGGSASFGNGQSIQGGGASTQFLGAVGASYNYLVNDFLTSGAYASYNSQLNRYESGDIDGSDLTSLRGGGYIDWLWTGKTTLGLKVEAGRMSQDILGDTTAAGQPAQQGIATRQFIQALVPVAHNLTSKVLLVAGAGASYTQDENIPDASSEYTGVRPVYLLGAQYDPSEKTTMRAYTSFDGFDIVPSYGFNLTWRPRVTTAFTFSAYQNQNFSITTVDQFQVNRGFTAGVQQTVFSRFAVGLSGGWQQTENISLSEDQPSGGDFDYAFVSGSLRYAINSWASWQATVMSSTGNRVNPSSSISFPETTASVGLNLLF